MRGIAKGRPWERRKWEVQGKLCGKLDRQWYIYEWYKKQEKLNTGKWSSNNNMLQLLQHVIIDLLTGNTNITENKTFTPTCVKIIKLKV